MALKTTRKLLTHLMRSQLQRRSCVRRMLETLRSSDAAYLVVDYKMKLLPQRHSEAQEFHFAKKGTSVHGVAILTARPGVTAAMLDELAATEDSSVLSTLSSTTGYFHVHYLCQIVSSKHSQDCFMTLGVIEDAVKFIATDSRYRHIRSVALQSDNAKT